MTIQPPTPTPDQTRDRVAFRLALVDSWRTEAGRADAQAGIIAAGLLAGLTIVATRPLPYGPVAVLVWWAGMTLGIAAVVALGVAIYPQIPAATSRVPRTIQHPWDALDAVRLGQPESLDEAIDRTMSELNDATRQVRTMSEIAAGGFRWTRRGMRMIPPTAALFVLSALLGGWAR